jgi:virulence factor
LRGRINSDEALLPYPPLSAPVIGVIVRNHVSTGRSALGARRSALPSPLPAPRSPVKPMPPMRVAVVGLGAIAEKAYLPVLAARADLRLVFCTRSAARLAALAAAYRVGDAVTRVDDAIALGVEAAFVHTATESHLAVAERLLAAGVHVYVDKPLAYTYADCERLVEAAERAGRTLMVGFNRRFAPAYRRVREAGAARLVVMQKNRTFLPDEARRFVYDDFVHVADTLRYFVGAGPAAERVTARVEGGRLHHVLLQLDAPGCAAVGLMNRDSGATEETLEVMAPGEKWVVRGLSTTVHVAGGEERTRRAGDWESVLHRRGFPQIVDHFVACVREGRAPEQTARDALETHALCERVVAAVEEGARAAGGA